MTARRGRPKSTYAQIYLEIANNNHDDYVIFRTPREETGKIARWLRREGLEARTVDLGPDRKSVLLVLAK